MCFFDPGKAYEFYDVPLTWSTHASLHASYEFYFGKRPRLGQNKPSNIKDKAKRRQKGR